MSFPERVAILLDGEFAKRALQKGRKRFPTAEDVMAEVRRGTLAHQSGTG